MLFEIIKGTLVEIVKAIFADALYAVSELIRKS